MRRILLSTSCLICFATPAFADIEAPAPDVAGVETPKVEEVVVSANRSPLAVTKVGNSISVLTYNEIKSRQVVVVSDVLAQLPGVNFSRNGGVGGTTSFRIRGAETDQTAVVIDGVKLNDPSSPGGGYNFANLVIGDIERVEVLRGAQSTLWGSQAIGGVVNIITAIPEAPLEGSAEVEGGSYGTGYARAGVGGKDGRFTWRAAGGYYTTDGISTFANGPERDGYHNAGASARLRVEITDNVSADLRGIYSYGRVELDGFPPPSFSFGDTGEYTTTKELIGYAGLNFDVWNGRLRNRIAFGYTDNDRDSYDPDGFSPITFQSRGKNKRWEYQGTLSIAEGWNAVFGAENEKSSIATADPFSPPLDAAVNIASGYLQINGEVTKGLTLTGGVRHDSHDTFGHHTLGQAALAWSLNDGDTVLRASFGQGFKAPTLYQLYSDFGNTSLKPEEADSWDAGITQKLFNGQLVVSATGFTRTAVNLISFSNCPGPAACRAGQFGVYENTSRARSRGVELEGTLTIDNFKLEANYTYTDARNTSAGDPDKGKELARRPSSVANVIATYVWPRGIATGIGVSYSGSAYDDAANTFLLPDYALVDLRISVPVMRNIEIYGRIENLFDAAHVTTRTYGSLGRAAYAGVRTHF
jgi:vitamin B12 transporter